MQDSLGDRMKLYENLEAGRHLMPLLPVVARVDGRAFHSFTRGMARPYDTRLIALMTLTAKALAEETNAAIAYTQSDEISLTWHSTNFDSQIFFNGRVCKMTSILAALATAHFNKWLPDLLGGDYARKMPIFDARVFNVPNRTEGANVFVWREKDAVRNSIQMAAQALYSHKQLHGKSCNELQEMLFAAGVNWNDYPDYFKRGSYIQRRKHLRPFTPQEIDQLPAAHGARKNPELIVERTEYERVDLPVLTTVINREAVLYDGAAPVTAVDQANLA